ncbi:MAG: hypothetical protein RIS47_2301, partial [Bacteroidota bacterium]
MDNTYDITIVGAGPVGLFASFYAGMRGMKALVVESREEAGGALTAIYPEKYIYDMVGFPKILARDLINNLEAQSSHFNNETRYNTTITNIVRKEEKLFELHTADGETILSRTVVITTGMGSFQPRQLPAAKEKGEIYEKQVNSGIRYAIRGKENYYGQEVVIVGGGNSALDWAHDFDGNSKAVTLVHREKDWQAHEESITTLPETGIKVYQPWTVKEIVGAEKLEKVILEHMDTHEEVEVKCDLLIVAIGYLPSKTKFAGLNLQYKTGAVIVEPSSLMSAEEPGIFAAGDASTFDGKLKLICVGSAEAAIAVNHALKFVDEKASLK